jgi:hypothetical protein
MDYSGDADCGYGVDAFGPPPFANPIPLILVADPLGLATDRPDNGPYVLLFWLPVKWHPLNNEGLINVNSP